MTKLLKILVILSALAALASPAAAQTITSVTGTILDPNNVPYAGATVVVTLQAPSGGASPTVTASGTPVIMPVNIVTSSTGSIPTLNLIANASITPASTTYSFRFCAPVVPPPIGTGNSCFTITGVTIAGASQDLSVTANAASLPLVQVSNQSRLFNTLPAAGTASIGATTMVAAVPAIPATGTHYVFSVYATQTVLGTSCAGNTTIAINAIVQDPNAAAPQTTAMATFTVTTNGTLGIIPLTASVYGGNMPFLAKAGSVVQYSTTFTPGGSCAPAPTVQVVPTLELQ
jgi:hypothetical protein